MRRTAADAEKTRISILESGINVFARDGYRKATLEAIGKDAHLTRGAIYWHFEDKRDLFEQILVVEGKRLDDLIESALAREVSPFRKLSTLLEAVIDNFHDNEMFRQFVELTWYKLDGEQLEDVMNEKTIFVQNFLALMERLLSESVESGDVKPGTDVRLAAYHLSCLINGFYRLYHVAPDWARDKDRTRQLFLSYFDTIRADASTPPPRETP